MVINASYARACRAVGGTLLFTSLPPSQTFTCPGANACALMTPVVELRLRRSELPEHKIQSRGGTGAASQREQTLELHLQPVPKMLGASCVPSLCQVHLLTSCQAS